MDFPTFQTLFRTARDEVLSRSQALTREIVERQGSDANALTAVGPAVGDECVGQLIRLQAALYLDSARGADLDRLVYDRYGMLRKAAAPAVGEVTFSTVAPAPLGFLIPAGTQLKTSDGRGFETTEDRDFLTGATSLSGVPVQSVLAGLAQQARIGTINQITGVIENAPADITVSNELATAGADDGEEDEDLRDRARKFYRTSKRGTLSAIESGALAVAGVRKATAFEILDADGDPGRIVELVIADAFTDQLVDSGTVGASYETQSQQLALLVRSALEDVRAAGIQVLVTVGVVRVIGVTLGLSYKSNALVAPATQQARATVVGYTNSLRPGGTWDPDAAELALGVVPGLFVTGGEVQSPPGPIVATQLEVIRTSLSLVRVAAS